MRRIAVSDRLSLEITLPSGRVEKFERIFRGGGCHGVTRMTQKPGMAWAVLLSGLAD